MKLKLLGLAALLLVPGLATSAHLDKAMAASASLTALDPDNDGTVDLQEAKAAAAKLFTKLDPDNDGTLDAKELSGRVDEAELKAADPDNDGTKPLSKRASRRPIRTTTARSMKKSFRPMPGKHSCFSWNNFSLLRCRVAWRIQQPRVRLVARQCSD